MEEPWKTITDSQDILSLWKEEMRLEFEREPDVYFIQSERGGPVKIGQTRDLKIRLMELQISHPYTLKILHVIEGAGPSIEKELHREFAKHRLRGEWFEWSEDLNKLINQLKKKNPGEYRTNSGKWHKREKRSKA